MRPYVPVWSGWFRRYGSVDPRAGKRNGSRRHARWPGRAHEVGAVRAQARAEVRAELADYRAAQVEVEDDLTGSAYTYFDFTYDCSWIDELEPRTVEWDDILTIARLLT